jgi:hypothetical protein
VASLDEDSLRPLQKAPPTALLEELARLIYLLRAPLPTLRLLRPQVASAWPAATPLGTTKGAIHWLVLDLDRVMSMEADERAFVLASTLAHLQCDHGAIFAAHLMAHRGHRLGLVKGLLRPWAKVSVFSADRAGLVAVRSLETALDAMERQAAEHVAWLPRWPDLSQRRQALQDFDRSTLMARRRVLSKSDGSGWSMAPPGREEELDSINQRIKSMFNRLRKVGEKIDEEANLVSQLDPNHAGPKQGPENLMYGREDKPPIVDAGEDAGEDEDDRAAERGATVPPLPRPAPPDPERASRLEEALGGAWSLTRCDARLTRRLGLL